MAESRSERKARLQSVPWIHYCPENKDIMGFDYGAAIKPPFPNAVPFYLRYEGAYVGKVGATEFTKKYFPTIKKPFFFQKKTINGSLFWISVDKSLSMRIDEPIDVKTYNSKTKTWVNLENFQTSLVVFVKSWDCNKVYQFMSDNKLYGEQLTLLDLANYVNKSFQKVMEEGCKQGILSTSNVYGKSVYVVPSFQALNKRTDTSSESFKQAVREKLYIVNEMNKALKAIGAQNGADDVINIGDHVTY